MYIIDLYGGSDVGDPTFPAPSSEQYGQARAIWEYYEGSKLFAYTLLYDIAINQGLALNTIADNSTEILKLLQNVVGLRMSAKLNGAFAPYAGIV